MGEASEKARRKRRRRELYRTTLGGHPRDMGKSTIFVRFLS